MNDELGARKEVFPTDQALVRFPSPARGPKGTKILSKSFAGILFLTVVWVRACLNCGPNEGLVIALKKKRLLRFTPCVSSQVPLWTNQGFFQLAVPRNNFLCFPRRYSRRRCLLWIFGLILGDDRPLFLCWRKERIPNDSPLGLEKRSNLKMGKSRPLK